ncbi:F-box domain-containing protein [Favolaschia claudopus]|uniref:F-box domain-containing protein n=1 Tax=Favolaschia claudopus TaxID=2862362 RepID=A0AAV9ZDI7_9AGAR
MSLEALHAKIADLDAEIGQQRELLQKLERAKSRLQCQINSVQDPLARLPLELSSQIFLRTLDVAPQPGAAHGPMLLLNICNSWSEIALAEPALWANIRITFGRTQNSQEILSIWLERARNKPLGVWLDGLLDLDLVAIVWRHAQQLKHLHLMTEGSYDDSDNGVQLWNPGSAPGQLPCLETLTIHGSLHERRCTKIFGPHILELLRLSPILSKCYFERCAPDSFSTHQSLVHRGLRELSIDDAGDLPLDCCAPFFASLSLPSLEFLFLPSIQIPYEATVSFLQRSTPPLRKLNMGEARVLLQCPTLFTALERLELYPSWLSAEKFLIAMDQSLSMLPNLAVWKMHFSHYSARQFFGLCWETLSNVLVARRTQIRVLDIQTPKIPAVQMNPAPDAVSTILHALVSDGMQINIDNFNRSVTSRYCSEFP